MTSGVNDLPWPLPGVVFVGGLEQRNTDPCPVRSFLETYNQTLAASISLGFLCFSADRFEGAPTLKNHVAMGQNPVPCEHPIQSPLK